MEFTARGNFTRRFKLIKLSLNYFNDVEDKISLSLF